MSRSDPPHPNRSVLHIFLMCFGVVGTIATLLAWFEISPSKTLPYVIMIAIGSLLLLSLFLMRDRRLLQDKVTGLERQILDSNSDDFVIFEHTVFSTEFEHKLLQKAESHFYIVGITHTRLCPPEIQLLLLRKHQSGCDVRLVFQDFDSPQDVLRKVGENSQTYHNIYAKLPIADFRSRIRDGFERFDELAKRLPPNADVFRQTSYYPVVPMIIVDDTIYTVPRFIARLFCDVGDDFNFDGISANGVSIRAKTWLGRILIRHFTMLWDHPEFSRRIRPSDVDEGKKT